MGPPRRRAAMGVVVSVAACVWASIVMLEPQEGAPFASSTLRAVSRFGDGDRATTPVAAFDVSAVPLVSAPLDNVKATAPCDARHDCVTCLYDGEATCAWCAASRQCMTALATRCSPRFESPHCPNCDDVEWTECPAVFHTSIPAVFRVIHVAIRKGGPEALIQLHLALHAEGFKTTLDTRKSTKQKGGEVVPFFKAAYKDDFARTAPGSFTWHQDYEAWLDSARDGDVLIATETWPCRNDKHFFAARGARQMQWHLTVWPKRPRQACTIASHTRYIATQYHAQSSHSVMFPYISPHILARSAANDGVVASASWRGKKDAALVMYDGDTLLHDKDLKPLSGLQSADPRLAAALVVRKATGFTPDDLYEMYGRMKAAVDLKLPGAERFVYEAALFQTCVVVDRTLNGLDVTDIPIPARFRVPPDDAKALHRAVSDCLVNYSTVIEEFEPLRLHVKRQRVVFYRHVRRYFSNSVHVVTAVATAADWSALPLWIATTLLQLPFASLEVLVGPALRSRLTRPETSKHEWLPRFDNATTAVVLNDNSYLAAVTFVPVATEAVEGADELLVGHPPQARLPAKPAFVMWLPVAAVLGTPNLVHRASSVIAFERTHRSRCNSVVGDAFVFSAASSIATARSESRWRLGTDNHADIAGSWRERLSRRASLAACDASAIERRVAAAASEWVVPRERCSEALRRELCSNRILPSMDDRFCSGS